MTELSRLDASPSSGLIVIPCLNEAANIEGLVADMHAAAERQDLTLVVADGGSTDGTLQILDKIAPRFPRLIVVANPRRLQSAALNLVAERFGESAEFLIRVDAHGEYPSNYCDQLIEEMRATNADSVVVGMVTQGAAGFQRAAAAAQNSKLGNGGSKHRSGARGHWIDHGHHALMRLEAFRAVGGYDESFSHNEDAELDTRLGAAGYRIWMTDRTHMRYFPRSTISGLFKQYLGYGGGRARNLLKHGNRPKPRQSILLLVAPFVVLSLLGPIWWWAALPAAAWAVACLGYGAVVAARTGAGPMVGVAAMVMHFAWSTGFWLHLLTPRTRPAPSLAA
ncbi:succinoglycan biosynthesis protein exoa [Aureimonas sp. SA4125]|nr:succinoglycan biosynthesis protein exoa [Aureimonas sp. SA4125]